MNVNYKNFSQNELNLALIEACEKGDIDKVKYLLTSPELTNHADIHANKDEPLLVACARNKFNIIKYLLNSDELKEHSNIHAKADTAFYKTLNNGNMEAIHYYIFDLNIEKNESIRCYLNLFPKEEKQIESWFNTRELGEKLHNKPSSNQGNKKSKI